MAKTLLVPEYIAKQKAQEKSKNTDPEVPSIEKLPKPTGWRLLILRFKGKKHPEGG